MAVGAKHSASVVKDGVVSCSGLKALMQAQAKALLNALNNALVLLTPNQPKRYDLGHLSSACLII